MATIRLVPGIGLVRDAESGNVVLYPGGLVKEAEPAPAPTALNNKRISAMHFQRIWEPTAMGE